MLSVRDHWLGEKFLIKIYHPRGTWQEPEGVELVEKGDKGIQIRGV